MITICEVSMKYHVSKDTLRFYEKEKLIGPIRKNKSGIREYQDSDLERIEFVLCMRSAGLSIAVLRKYQELYDKGDNTKEMRLNLLLNEKKKLKEKIKCMNDAFKKLEYKIKLYQES